MFFIIHSKKGNVMNKKQKFIAGAMALTLITSAAPMSVSAKAKAKAPAKVTVTSVKRVNNTKTTVKWKKLKKNTSGYAVYVKAGSSKWRLTKKVGKKTASVTFATSPESKYQVKVRAYKNGKKVKKYYNKKAKKFVSKKAYKKLKKKNRTTKRVTSVKWGKCSSTKTINAVFGNKINTPNGNFDKNEDAALTWTKVKGAKKYEVARSQDGAYKTVATVSSNAYTDTTYNPMKKMSYKVRPMNGSYAGNWSKAMTMDPAESEEGHQHQWKETTEQVETLAGWDKKTEGHTICLYCIEMGRESECDIDNLSLKASKWYEEHPDGSAFDNPYDKEYDAHIDRDKAEYKSGANTSGSNAWHNTSTDVTIYRPIKKTINVTTYVCEDCGAKRCNTAYKPYNNEKSYAIAHFNLGNGRTEFRMDYYANGEEF